MSDIKNSETHSNLLLAFARETQNNHRYRYFAKMADVEGYTEAASAFRDIAEGDIGHAHGHLDFLREIGDPITNQPIRETIESLMAAHQSEQEAANDKYPKWAEMARTEGYPLIASWFDNLAQAKASHAARFADESDAI
jgi:rubrerythrin